MNLFDLAKTVIAGTQVENKSLNIKPIVLSVENTKFFGAHNRSDVMERCPLNVSYVQCHEDGWTVADKYPSKEAVVV